MLKWIGIIVAILFTLGFVNYVRQSFIPRRRLKRFLQNRGVQFVRIDHLPGSYGWPGYLIVFDSNDNSSAFRNSENFKALIEEVNKIHSGLSFRKQIFDANLAVDVSPGP